jgi:hypothetical protein
MEHLSTVFCDDQQTLADMEVAKIIAIAGRDNPGLRRLLIGITKAML